VLYLHLRTLCLFFVTYSILCIISFFISPHTIETYIRGRFSFTVDTTFFVDYNNVVLDGGRGVGAEDTIPLISRYGVVLDGGRRIGTDDTIPISCYGYVIILNGGVSPIYASYPTSYPTRYICSYLNPSIFAPSAESVSKITPHSNQ
jgi:hypothetical protein